MIDIIGEITDILEYHVEIEDLGERAGDVPANYASAEKLMAVTNWRPQVSLHEGLRRESSGSAIGRSDARRLHFRRAVWYLKTPAAPHASTAAHTSGAT